MADVVGRRVICDGYRGTVKYYGLIPSTSGEWLGVEWDDETRGKHDGVLDGVRYFKCSDPTGGSFIRPKKVNFGVSVIEALKQRYGVDDVAQDMYVVDGKNRKTAVEMVGTQQIQEIQSCFEKLCDVSLREQNVRGPSEEMSLHSLAPSIVHLDLSKNLIICWEDVAQITRNMNNLKSLNVSENHLTLPTVHSSLLYMSFCNIKELRLNRMNLSWKEVSVTIAMFPQLEELHICHNSINTLSKNEKSNQLESIVTLNLEGNSLSDWKDVLLLGHLPRLTALILNDNQITEVQFDDVPGTQKTDQFSSLKSLSLSKNDLQDITSINALDKLASLIELRFKDNPVFKGETSFSTRQELISRIASLKILNGSPVTDKERQAAERSYLKTYSKEWFATGENPGADFVRKHPRYTALIEAHGLPEDESRRKASKTLKDSLILLTFKCPDDQSKAPITKKLPGTMTIGKLKGLLHRVYKIDSADQKLSYLDTKNDREIPLEDDLRQLTFYSVVEGDTIYLRW